MAFSRSNRQTVTDAESVYQIFALSENHKQRLLLDQLNSYKTSLKRLRELGDMLKCTIVEIQRNKQTGNRKRR